MFRAILIASLGTALVLTAIWGSFYVYHMYPIFQDKLEWWGIPLLFTMLFFDAIILVIGYAMIKASGEKLKEESSQ